MYSFKMYRTYGYSSFGRCLPSMYKAPRFDSQLCVQTKYGDSAPLFGTSKTAARGSDVQAYPRHSIFEVSQCHMYLKSELKALCGSTC